MEKTLVWASDEEACGAIFPGGPVALAYSRFLPEQRAEVHAEFLASIAQHRREGAYHVPGEFVFVAGKKEG